jgi:chromosome segregation ATPase
MTVKEGIEQIKVLLSGQTELQTEEVAQEPATELTFETYDLMDGSKIDLSSLEIGADAMLVDESGNAVAAPNGEYELADGTMVSVVEGKVEGIESPIAEMPEVEDELTKDKEEEMSNQFDEMDATINYLKAENEALKAKLNEMDGKFNQAFEKVFVLVEELAKMPSADAIQAPKQSFKVTESKADKVDRFMAKFVK